MFRCKLSTMATNIIRFSRSSRALLPILVLASCATVQRLSFQAPTASLDGVEITGIGLQGGSLRLLLDVVNPNSYEIRTTRLEVGLDLEGVHFGDAFLEDRVVLEPNETTRVIIPMRFTWSGVGAGARALLASGSVRYVMESRVWIGTPLGDRTVELRNEGQVPLADLAR